MGIGLNDPFDGPVDATPLGPDEREGLKPTWITYRQELNEAEHSNVTDGMRWAWKSRGRDLLTEEFIKELHKRLFGNVWTWAGEFRRTRKNIGIEVVQIPVQTRMTFDDTCFWIEHETYPPDEIALRLHHRLVSIHPFPNGNGRTTRLMGDLVAVRLGRKAFTWGSHDLTEINETRQKYIAALRAADNHIIEPLLEFARS